MCETIATDYNELPMARNHILPHPQGLRSCVDEATGAEAVSHLTSSSFTLAHCPVMSIDHILTFADLDDSVTPPIMRAASCSDPSVLRAVIKYGASLDEKRRRDVGLSWQAFSDCDSLSLQYDSPLQEAIRAELPENVALLISAGSDPNGLLADMLSRFSAQYLRFRRHRNHITRNEALKLISESQLSPLTSGELSCRRKTRTRFWTSESFVTTCSVPRTARTALETAASTGNIEIFDQILAAEPEISWWMVNSQTLALPTHPLHSFLSISTPLHAAIEAGNNDMVMYMIDKGFSPNTVPVSATIQCISPLMATVASCAPPNLEAYDLLLSYAHTNRDLRTPVFNVHILHFVTALLSFALLERVAASIPLSNAGTTALGHTLLHVACMPSDDTYIQIYSEKVYQSIHNVRTLSTSWIPLELLPHEQNRKDGLVRNYEGLSHLQDPSITDTTAQIKVVEFLLRSSTLQVNATDKDGNSAMHYVAGSRVVSEELLQMLRAVDGGEHVWMNEKNMWGWTPRDLYRDGKSAVAEPYKPFWG